MEAEADTLFSNIEQRYEKLRQLAKEASTRPSVITGTVYKGIWYAPGGKSYMAQFLKDAGADYPWAKDSTSGSLKYDLEAVYANSGNCDYWGFAEDEKVDYSLEDLLSEDPTYKRFKAARMGNVFFCNTNTNDFFGAAVLEPDVILADLISIFHPDLLPKAKQSYFSILK